MKKVILSALISIFYLSLFSQSENDSKFRVGIGSLYSSEIESTGITIKGVYAISNKWELSAGYAHVFENLGLSWEVIDVDGHFVFYNNDKRFNIYALSGLAFTYWKRETIGTILIPKQTLTGNYIGMNIGVGCNIGLSKHLNLSPEIRGTLFDLSYTRIGITIQYMF